MIPSFFNNQFYLSGAWIITGGMNTGIMKLVGEIIQINPDRSRPIHLIVRLEKRVDC
jgi:hypothetical protein